MTHLISQLNKQMLKAETMEKMKYMRSSVLEKNEYEERLKKLQEKLQDGQISRDDIDKSLGLLPVNDRTGKRVALTFDDRVKLFEEGLEERNKNAEDFVKKM